MPQELDLPKDRPTIFLESIVGNRKTVRQFVTNPEAREGTLDRASNEIASFSGPEARSFVRTLFQGLGREDKTWTADTRDIALDLLELVDLGKVRHPALLGEYSAAIATQGKDSDLDGTVDSLLEAGRRIAMYLPPGEETRQKVKTAWYSIAEGFEEKEKRAVINKADAIIGEIPLNVEELVGMTEMRLGWREKPNFEPGERTLHDKYLDVVGRDTSFKWPLWRSVPNYIDLCLQNGARLERFWNINDPDQAAAALDRARGSEFAFVQGSLDHALRQEAGVSLAEITTEQARVMADEVTKAAGISVDKLASLGGSFDSILSRFRGLLREAETKPPRAQRALINPITNFFRENDIEVAGTTLPEVVAILSDSEILVRASNEYDAKQQSRQAAVAQLRKLFSLDHQNPSFSLMSRRRDDLFLGDLTGDCTSYHLVVGMNAWTVPIWLTNPGFNFLKMVEDDKLVAKAGLLLSVADGLPALTVDSIEVGTGLSDQESAADLIRGGFRFLRQWAENIGLSRTYLNKYSNSSDLSTILQGLSRPAVTRKIYALGGLTGIAEARQNLIGEKADERIYLQSHSWEGMEDIRDDSGPLIQEFENIVSKSLNEASVADRRMMEKLAGEKNWPELFTYILQANYAGVAKLVGGDWTIYEKLMDALELDEKGGVNIELLPFQEDSLPVAARVIERQIDFKVVDSADDFSLDDMEVLDQAYEVDKLLILLKEMDAQKISAGTALEYLYGKIKEEEERNDPYSITLNRNMPVLTA